MPDARDIPQVLMRLAGAWVEEGRSQIATVTVSLALDLGSDADERAMTPID